MCSLHRYRSQGETNPSQNRCINHTKQIKTKGFAGFILILYRVRCLSDVSVDSVRSDLFSKILHRVYFFLISEAINFIEYRFTMRVPQCAASQQANGHTLLYAKMYTTFPRDCMSVMNVNVTLMSHPRLTRPNYDACTRGTWAYVLNFFLKFNLAPSR